MNDTPFLGAIHWDHDFTVGSAQLSGDNLERPLSDIANPLNGASDLICDLHRIVGRAPEKPTRGSSEYRFDLGVAIIDVAMSHDYQDDYGIAFSKYPLAITVRDLDSDKNREESRARELFESLHSDSAYTGILVYDLRRPLARSLYGAGIDH